ncbi:hypothetical protein BG262_02865 [Floricoccus penangensis]|uniref:Uncharacterized protein n=1 Tax=Floricoccus penangensis TaxID=1859475 RepID=A0A9Q5JGW5_9LACT|nr:hypothetical protein [Floricoccus penangensis]OFI46756.1 hypothetical protein BG262_02865 [Floricoccus penangensis]
MAVNPFGGNVFGEMWEAVEENVEERAKECEKIMKKVINEDTGALKDAVERAKLPDGSWIVGINQEKLRNDIRNKYNIDYTAFYYYGTRPHYIFPLNNEMLHWVDKQGRDHYAKMVKHPGTDPHNFLQETLNKMK